MTLAPGFFGQIPAPAPPGGAGAKIFRFWESATHLIFISIRAACTTMVVEGSKMRSKVKAACPSALEPRFITEFKNALRNSLEKIYFGVGINPPVESSHFRHHRRHC